MPKEAVLGMGRDSRGKTLDRASHDPGRKIVSLGSHSGVSARVKRQPDSCGPSDGPTRQSPSMGYMHNRALGFGWTCIAARYAQRPPALVPETASALGSM